MIFMLMRVQNLLNLVGGICLYLIAKEPSTSTSPADQTVRYLMYHTWGP